MCSISPLSLKRTITDTSIGFEKQLKALRNAKDSVLEKFQIRYPLRNIQYSDLTLVHSPKCAKLFKDSVTEVNGFRMTISYQDDFVEVLGGNFVIISSNKLSNLTYLPSQALQGILRKISTQFYNGNKINDIIIEECSKESYVPNTTIYYRVCCKIEKAEYNCMIDETGTYYSTNRIDKLDPLSPRFEIINKEINPYIVHKALNSLAASLKQIYPFRNIDEKSIAFEAIEPAQNHVHIPLVFKYDDQKYKVMTDIFFSHFTPTNKIKEVPLALLEKIASAYRFNKTSMIITKVGDINWEESKIKGFAVHLLHETKPFCCIIDTKGNLH